MGSGGGGTGCTINSVAVNSGGKGGGGIWFEVENTLTVSGTISANGGDGSEFLCDAQSGGGAGGSIYIVTDTFAGAGDIVAKGGKGGQTLLRGGGGGGGRIAVYYETSTFSGDALALGGFGKTESGVSGSGHDGTVGFFDTDGNDFSAGHDWRFQFDDQPFDFDTITIDDGSQTTTEGTITITGTQLIVDGNSTLILSDFDSLSIKDVTVTGSSSIEGNLLLQANNLTIASGSEVSADEYGFIGGRGVGAGLPNQGQGGGGGGYGGAGGTSLGGIAYGSPTAPVDFGSGGAGPGFGSVLSSGGSGGGKIQLTISGTLTVDGVLSADGGNGLPQGSQSGGGSGGSIYVITEKFTGSGSITVIGGDSQTTGGAAAGGGGAGGRIAIFHRQSETFSNTPLATGGDGVGEDGENGTVVVQQSELAVNPNEGGDTGTITVVLSGSVFSQDGVIVNLEKSGEDDIPAENIIVKNNGTTLKVTFDLTGKAQGTWDVVVMDADNVSKIISDGFTVEEGLAPEPWVQLIGRPAIRPDREQNTWIAYGNRGNTDIWGANIFVQIPENTTYKIDSVQFEDTESDTVVHNYVQAHLPSRKVGVLPVAVRTSTSSGTFEMHAAISDNYQEFRTQHSVSTPSESYTPPTPFVPVDDYTVSLYLGGRENLAPGYVDFNLVHDPEFGSFSEISIRTAGNNVAWSYPGRGVEEISFADIKSGVIIMPRVNDDNGNPCPEPGECGTKAVVINNVFTVRPDTELNMTAIKDRTDNTLSSLLNKSFCSEQTVENTVACRSCVGLAVSFVYENGVPPFGEGNENLDTWRYLKEWFEVSKVDGRILNDSLTDNLFNPIWFDWWTITRFVLLSDIVSSRDPNEKIGPQGIGSEKYVPLDEPLTYSVFFENVESANAPAQEVIITDELDTDYFDIDTFSLGPISFGDTIITPPDGLKEYITEVDLRPENDLIVRLEAGLEINSGIVTWKFTSLDPETHKFTENPSAGFLPPNDNPPEGDGSVLFTVYPKDDLSTEDEIGNTASIVFDTNSPITTNEWINTIDNTKPQSSMNSMDSTGTLTSFDISWSGSDAHSGVKEFTVYVSENSGPFVEELTTTGTMTSFVGVNGSTYSFYTRAKDNVGNIEDAPETPDETITIEDPMQEPCTINTDYMVGVNCFGTTTVTNNSQLEDYLTDYDYNGSNYKNLYINYSPTMDNMDIHSPCEITVAANKTMTAERICIDGRKGIDTATGLTVNGTLVSFISELEDSSIGGTATITANSLFIQAYKSAEIHSSALINVDGPILIKSTGNTSTSWVKMGQSSTINAESVRLEAVREASTGTGMQLTVENELEIISTGTESSSKVFTGISSEITTGSLEMSADKSVEIGNSSSIEIAEDASLTSTGASSTSDVYIKLESVISADSLDMIAGDDAVMQTDSEVHITNNFHMQAASTNDCTISGSAVIDAGSESGNCL